MRGRGAVGMADRAASSRRACYGDAVDARRHWIVWDGECGFCRRAVDWALARDRRRLFEAVRYQMAPTPPMTPELRAACRRIAEIEPDHGIRCSIKAGVLDRCGDGYLLPFLGHGFGE